MPLKRAITLPFLTCYGLGTILGAGIYVLVGKVAIDAGVFTPLSFLLAAIVASFTAYSYGKLSSLYPKSAGEAVYMQKAFGTPLLSKVVGWLIICTGVVSAATIANGFVGYLHLFIDIPKELAITLLVGFLTLLALWGIQESIAFATIVTLLEFAGLLLVLWIAPPKFVMTLPSFSVDSIGIGMGAFLAFYAYIGFEDMVNIAEEVKNPKKNLPIAIFIALIISTVLYILIAQSAITTLPLKELQNSDAPLALIIEKAGWSPTTIGFISLFAVINGALVQIIMAARVAYGMASQGLAHSKFATVHPKRQTPTLATLFVSGIVLVLALIFPLVTLAKVTSFVILLIFTLVNLAYVKIQTKKRAWISILGALLCLALLGIALHGIALQSITQ